MGLHIDLHQVSKRYNKHWVLRQIDYSFESGGSYSIAGANGSGKSSLLRMLSGYLSPSEGKLVFSKSNEKIDPSRVYKHISFAAPYISVPVNLSIREVLYLVNSFKPYRNNWAIGDVFKLMELPLSIDTFVNELSSGQLQRVNLATTIAVQSDLMLLDEPGSYLDVSSLVWMKKLIELVSEDTTIVIASNSGEDFLPQSKLLDISQFR